MSDTVTYPLSAIMDEDEESPVEQLERELVAARAELVETKKELNDKRKFCYAVEQALDGLKGDYVEIIKELRTDAEKYRYCFNAAIDAAMKECGK